MINVNEMYHAINEIKNGINVKQNYQIVYDANSWLINKTAKDYLSHGIEMADLKQEAYFAIVRAVDQYDPDKWAFGTYLGYHLRTVFDRYVEDAALIRVPAWEKSNILKYNKFQTEYLKEHGKEPSDSAYCKALNLTSKQLLQLRQDYFIRAVESTDKKILNGDKELIDREVPDPEDYTGDVENKIDAEISGRQLWKMVDRLSPTESDVIRSKYKDCMTYAQIADKRKCSIANIGATHDRAIKHLKADNAGIKRLLFLLDYDALQTKAVQGNGVGKFKRTGSSSTEFLAIKRLETEKQLADMLAD